jgi:hypothetical protein
LLCCFSYRYAANPALQTPKPGKKDELYEWEFDNDLFQSTVNLQTVSEEGIQPIQANSQPLIGQKWLLLLMCFSIQQ